MFLNLNWKLINDTFVNCYGKEIAGISFRIIIIMAERMDDTDKDSWELKVRNWFRSNLLSLSTSNYQIPEKANKNLVRKVA